MSENFIKMVSEIHNQKYLSKIKFILSQKIPCGFFTGFNLRGDISEVVNTFKSNGFNLNCICTLDAAQTGGGIDIPIVTLEDFPNFEPKPPQMFYFDEFKNNAFIEFFSRYGVQFFSMANTEYADRLYNFYFQNLEKLYRAYKIFDEEESKKVFLETIKGKLTKQIKDFRFAPEPQYFLEGFFPTEGDIAIDGGAYDGATSRDFAMQGAQVYAFEMSSKNYQKCLPRAEKFGFTLENLGLSNKEGEEFYFQGGAGSGKGQGNLVGKFIDLDTYVLKKDLPRVDYIKLDIEGAELDMLQGAAKTISRWKPKMAVSAYHKPEDLWTLAFYIKSLRADYEFKFRHYKIDCTDYFLNDEERAILQKFGLSYFLPTGCEMVLYCR